MGLIIGQGRRTGNSAPSMDGVVRYDIEQSLTNEQKAQVKENIGAQEIAPNDPSPTTAVLQKLKIDGTNFSIEGNSAKAYNNISAMVTALNAMGATDLKIGNNLYISTIAVPDLWVRAVESASVPYTYTTDDAFISALSDAGESGLQIGYYRVRALEAEKVVVPVQDIQVDDETVVVNGVAKFVSEEWTATLTDGTTVTKKVILSDD